MPGGIPMQRQRRTAFVLLVLFGVCNATSADWRQFRGPDGQGVSNEKGLPVEWSAQQNLLWKTRLPGPGSSSPVVVGNRVFVTCYSGYALDTKKPGNMDDLKRHLLCVDQRSGNVLWAKEFAAELPEHVYKGEGSYHGYSSSTPISDGERLYVFFGKSGVYCFNLDGKELWHVSVGKKVHDRWGSAASPMLYKDMLIVNASSESNALVALDRLTGKERWRTPGINETWDTPILVKANGETELVLSVPNWLKGFNPDTGKELWKAEGVHRYVCPSVVAHDGVIYGTGGGSAIFAIKAGGRGDVTKTHVLWRINKKGSNVPSPIYHEGYLYWPSDGGGLLHCQEAATGKFVYSERLKPAAGQIWASPVLAGGNLYIVSKQNGTYVVACRPKFEPLAHNVFADDKSRTNASIAVSGGELLLRTDLYLYCIGKR